MSDQDFDGYEPDVDDDSPLPEDPGTENADLGDDL